jgi:hypothetical protein
MRDAICRLGRCRLSFSRLSVDFSAHRRAITRYGFVVAPLNPAGQMVQSSLDFCERPLPDCPIC